MVRHAAVMLLLGFLALSPAHTAPARAEWSTDGDEELLPIGETPAERALRPLLPELPLVSDPPPAGPLRNVAEYEPMTGALIRYPLGLPYNLIRDITADVMVHVIVSSTYYSTAVANFVANGVDTSRVRWVVAPNNSIWTRDYGPWFVFDGNGDEVILDHHYNRPTRPDDDRIPIVLGGLWGIPVVSHDLWHTGGNYMTEGHGLSFSTELVWTENPGMTHEEIAQFMRDYYGVDDYEVVPDIALGGIHHIDCWAKLLDEETVLVKQVASSHPDYARLEADAATIAGLTDKYGRPFRVVRVYCPPIATGDVAAYTNSLIMNQRVYVPVFGLGAADSTALQVYRDAMPGYLVRGYRYTGGSSFVSDDALHCRVMGIADRYMLRIDHAPLLTATEGRPVPVSACADDRSETGIDLASSAVRWRVAGASSFNSAPFTPEAEPDWYTAEIPAEVAGTEIEYYVTFRDLSGRTETRPRTAPAALDRFRVEAATAVAASGAGAPDPMEAAPPEATLRATPTPFRSSTWIRFSVRAAGRASLAVYDASGREIARLADRVVPAGETAVEWTGRDGRGVRVASGIYYLVLETSSGRVTRRVVLAR